MTSAGGIPAGYVMLCYVHTHSSGRRGVEPLVARLREQRPDLDAGAEQVGERWFQRVRMALPRSGYNNTEYRIIRIIQIIRIIHNTASPCRIIHSLLPVVVVV